MALMPIISIGPETDKALCELNLDDSCIPRLRDMVQTERSTKWGKTLKGEGWGLDGFAAACLVEAILADIEPEKLRAKVGICLQISGCLCLIILAFAEGGCSFSHLSNHVRNFSRRSSFLPFLYLAPCISVFDAPSKIL